MKSPVTVCFAHKMEAKEFLHHSSIKFIKTEAGCFESGKGIRVYIIGVGERAVKQSLQHIYVQNSELVIKAGTCALLDEAVSVLRPYVPARVRAEDNREWLEVNIQLFPLNKEIWKDRGLVTLKKPLENSGEVQALKTDGAAFADMETSLLREKWENTVPLLVGTDYGNAAARNDFFHNVKQASVVLKETLEKWLKVLV